MKKTLVVAALALGGLAIQSCGSKKESLVVVSLTASPANADLSTVTISVGGVSKTFPINPTGLDDFSPTLFGVYVPDSVTGLNLLVAATARVAGSPGCYTGESTDTNIPSAGVTVNTSIQLEPGKSCGGSSGAAGTGSGAGMAGAGGAAGDMGNAGAGGAAGDMGSAGAGGNGGTTGMAGAGGMGGTTGMAGAGGMGGTTGMAGAGGTGGTGQVIPPPTLTKCTEYDHIVGTCTEGGAGDWAVWSVAFSPDGKFLLTAAQDSRVKVWKMNGTVPVADGHEIATNGQAYIAFSADGKRLAVGSKLGQLTLHDTSTWAIIGSPTGLTGHIEGVGFSPDGTKIFAADTDKNLTMHAVGNDTPLRAVVLPDAAYSLSVSPVQTSSIMNVGVGYLSGFADVLNMAATTVTPTKSLTISSDAGTTLAYATFSTTFSPDGKTFVAGSEDGLTSFFALPLAAMPKPVGTVIKTTDAMANPLAVNGMMFAPDGRNIAMSVGTDFNGGRTGIWDAATHGTKGAKVPTYYPVSVAFSPDGKIVAAGEVACGKVLVCAD
jgi:WD40 repeat protein